MKRNNPFFRLFMRLLEKHSLNRYQLKDEWMQWNMSLMINQAARFISNLDIYKKDVSRLDKVWRCGRLMNLVLNICAFGIFCNILWLLNFVPFETSFHDESMMMGRATVLFIFYIVSMDVKGKILQRQSILDWVNWHSVEYGWFHLRHRICIPLY